MLSNFCGLILISLLPQFEVKINFKSSEEFSCDKLFLVFFVCVCVNNIKVYGSDIAVQRAESV